MILETRFTTKIIGMLRQDFSTAYEFQKWKNPTHRNRTYCGSESCIAILLFPFVILLDIWIFNLNC